MAYLPPESEDGCVEYKLRLRDGNPFRLQQLITQMKFRLCEGGAQCFYYLGALNSSVVGGLCCCRLVWVTVASWWRGEVV